MGGWCPVGRIWKGLACLALLLAALPAGAQVPPPLPLPPTPEALQADIQALRKEHLRQQRKLDGVRTALKDQLLHAQQDIAALQNELEKQRQAAAQARRERGNLQVGLAAGVVLGLTALLAAARGRNPGPAVLATEIRGLRRRRRNLLADLQAQDERARRLRRALEEDRIREG